MRCTLSYTRCVLSYTRYTLLCAMCINRYSVYTLLYAVPYTLLYAVYTLLYVCTFPYVVYTHIPGVHSPMRGVQSLVRGLHSPMRCVPYPVRYPLRFVLSYSIPASDYQSQSFTSAISHNGGPRSLSQYPTTEAPLARLTQCACVLLHAMSAEAKALPAPSLTHLSMTPMLLGIYCSVISFSSGPIPVAI